MKRLSSKSWLRISPYILTALWAMVSVAIWFFDLFGAQNAELQTYNTRFHLRGRQPPDPRVVLIAIDEKSILNDLDSDELKENPDYALLKEFPYPRRAYALAIDRIMKSGARGVVFDLLFTKEGVKEDDEALKKVLERYKDQVVIGANHVEGNDAYDTRTIMFPHDSIMPKVHGRDADITGFVNYRYDKDGYIRRMQPVGWPVLSRDANNSLVVVPEETLPYSIDALIVKKTFPEIVLPYPLQEKFINFSGPMGTYEPYPFYLLLTQKTWNEDIPPFHKGKFLKDKIVLIGPRANFMHDDHHAPFGSVDESSGVRTPKMPGVDIHAQAIATLLRGNAPREMIPWMTYCLILIMALIFAFIISLPKTPLGKLIPAMLVAGIYMGVVQWCFLEFSLFVPVVPVLVLMTGSASSVVVLQAVVDQIEKRRVTGMFQRYVSKNVADELIKSGEDVNSLLVPRKRTVTVLFSDVRDFTTMTESCEPGPFVQQLNEYLTEMVSCVFDNKGTVDKFVGDAVMAVFGNPNSAGAAEDAWRGVRTAMSMRERLAKLNERWKREGRPIFRIGIGLNHGDVMAGDIGSSQKKEFGVIGDTVNTTARVESLTKDQKTDILITESVYQYVKDRVDVENRGQIKVKGRAQLVEIYALKSLKIS